MAGFYAEHWGLTADRRRTGGGIRDGWVSGSARSRSVPGKHSERAGRLPGRVAPPPRRSVVRDDGGTGRQAAVRPGGSRLERLPKSTAGEIVTGKRLPTRGKLLTFLAVCEVAPAALAQWLAAWERAITADLARPVGAVRVRHARPHLLGVHEVISVPGAPDDVLPQYVLRDVDATEFGIRARVAAAAQRGGFVLLVGGSSVGKTRCAFEAVKTLLPDW